MKIETKEEVFRYRFNTLRKMRLEIFNEKKLSSSARLVWFVFWSSARANGRVRLSYDRIAAESGLSRRTCIKLVKELKDKGVLRLVKRGGFPNRVNLYAIRIFPPKRKGKPKKTPR